MLFLLLFIFELEVFKSVFDLIFILVFVNFEYEANEEAAAAPIATDADKLLITAFGKAFFP